MTCHFGHRDVYWVIFNPDRLPVSVGNYRTYVWINTYTYSKMYAIFPCTFVMSRRASFAVSKCSGLFLFLNQLRKLHHCCTTSKKRLNRFIVTARHSDCKDAFICTFSLDQNYQVIFLDITCFRWISSPIM